MVLICESNKYYLLYVVYIGYISCNRFLMVFALLVCKLEMLTWSKNGELCYIFYNSGSDCANIWSTQEVTISRYKVTKKK